jgi:hypothetical protein
MYVDTDEYECMYAKIGAYAWMDVYLDEYPCVCADTVEYGCQYG